VQPPSAVQILRMWERGAALPPVARTLSLLGDGDSEQPLEGLAALSVGERDARLLALRQSLLGSTLSSVSECPHCATAIEFSLDADGLHVPVSQMGEAPLCLTCGDIVLRYRRLNSSDLAALAGCTSVEQARRRLVERCVIEAHQGDAPLDAANLPEAAIQALSEGLADADGQADVTLNIRCPECGGTWSAAFDIGSFLWTEISVRAKQLLADVHTLAWAYGWSEAEILAMSDARRRFYLGKVE
jgi:hypothetical protein